MNLKPLYDRIVVEPLAAEEKTKGGIVLPDTAKEKPQIGKVIAVGPGRIDEKGQRISGVKLEESVYASYPVLSSNTTATSC